MIETDRVNYVVVSISINWLHRYKLLPRERHNGSLSFMQVIVLRVIEADRVNDDAGIADNPAVYAPKRYAAAKVRFLTRTR